MPINPSIALSYQAPQMPDLGANALRIQQMQGAMQDQQMNALKLQEAARSMKEQSDVRNYLAQNPDFMTNPDAMKGLYGISPTTAMSLGKTLAEQQSAAETFKKNRFANAASEMDMFTRRLSEVRTPEQALAWRQAVADSPTINAVFSNMDHGPGLAAVPKTQDEVAAWVEKNLTGWSSAKDQAAMRASQAAQETAAGNLFYKTGIETPAFRDLKGAPQPPPAPTNLPVDTNVLSQPIDGAGAAQPPPVNALATTPPAANVPKVNLPPQKAAEVETDRLKNLNKIETKKQEAKPEKTAAVQSVLADVNRTNDLIDSLLTPERLQGLQQISGKYQGRFPDLSSMIASGNLPSDVLNDLRSIQSGTFVTGLENAKAAGVSFGNLSNLEGQEVKAARAAIGTSQSTEQLIRNLIRYRNVLQSEGTRARKAFEKTYGELLDLSTTKLDTGMVVDAKTGQVNFTLPDGGSLGFKDINTFRKAQKEHPELFGNQE